MQRSSLVRGPGIVIAGSTTLVAVGGINGDLDLGTFEVANDIQGKTDTRMKDAVGRVSFTPSGRLSYLPVLFPAWIRTPAIGQSIFGATDVPCAVHSRAGKKLTFKASAITKIPTLFLGATKTLFGPAEFTCVRADNAEVGDENSLYELSDAEFPELTLASADELTQAYTAAWGELIAEIVAEGGWQIDTTLAAPLDDVDGTGSIDAGVDSVSVIARCRPKNLSETLLNSLKVQGSGAAIGASLRQAANLVISGDGLVVTVHDAALIKGPQVWRKFEVREGEIAFVGHISEDEAAAGKLLDLDTGEEEQQQPAA